ncbi:MAG: hypothetical protein EOP08_12560 [Proteobacteria bacterium]|nr:MAG: hypothetical protein EOP08_12560 [Pseudomonadota bacterium]
MRYLNDVAEHVEELERLATLGSRGAGLAWPQRAATEMVRVDPPADSYWAIVQQVRQSSFRPTHWRFGAELRSSVRGESGQNYWVIAAPTHDGWHEGSSVFVQVLTDDAVAVSSAARTAVRSALAAKRYRSLRGPVTAPDSALLSLRDESSASGAVREAVRVHEQLLAICAAH